MHQPTLMIALTFALVSGCGTGTTETPFQRSLHSGPTLQQQLVSQGLNNIKIADVGGSGGGVVGFRFADPTSAGASGNYAVLSEKEDVIKWFVITLARTARGNNVNDEISLHRGQQVVLTRKNNGKYDGGGALFTNVPPGDYFLQVAAIVEDSNFPGDVSKGFNVAKNLNIVTTPSGTITNFTHPTNGGQDFITVKFTVNPLVDDGNLSRLIMSACLEV